jgi:hypothetical protein
MTKSVSLKNTKSSRLADFEGSMSSSEEIGWNLQPKLKREQKKRARESESSDDAFQAKELNKEKISVDSIPTADLGLLRTSGHKSVLQKYQNSERLTITSRDSDSLNRSKRRAAGGPWNCAACSFENVWLDVSCQMCSSPRPSVRTVESVRHSPDSSDKTTLSDDRLLSIVEQQKRRIEGARLAARWHHKVSKQHASLKALARLASSTLSSSFETTAGEFGSLLLTEDALVRSGTFKRRGKEETVCGPLNATLRKQPSRNLSSISKNRSSNDLSDRSKPRILDSTSSTSMPLKTGSLVKYAFQTETREWLWYLGLIQSVWHNNNSWFKVMFEDGEQLWVRLDTASQGRLWATVDDSESLKETLRFEEHLELASPGTVAKLRADMTSSTISKIDHLHSSHPRSSSQDDYKKRGRCVSYSQCFSLESHNSSPPRKKKKPLHRHDIYEDIDDELAITSCSRPPDNWSHPPSVNALEPSGVTIIAASADNCTHKSKNSNEPPGTSQGNAKRWRSQTDVPSSITAASKTIPKRKINILKLTNGEYFAILEVDSGHQFIHHLMPLRYYVVNRTMKHSSELCPTR